MQRWVFGRVAFLHLVGGQFALGAFKQAWWHDWRQAVRYNLHGWIRFTPDFALVGEYRLSPANRQYTDIRGVSQEVVNGGCLPDSASVAGRIALLRRRRDAIFG